MQVKWIEQINRKDFKVTDITENSRVCEKHFTADNFVEDDLNVTKTGGKKVKRSLRPRAFPTLFLSDNRQKISNDTVQQEQSQLIQEQARQIETLKRKLEEASGVNKEQEVERKKLKVDSLKYEVLHENLQKIWNDDQIERIILPPSSNTTFYTKTIEESIKALALCGGKGFDYMTNELNLPYAKKRTCQRHLARIECEPGGVPTDFGKLLRLKVQHFSEQERCCALNVDEMSVQAKYQYDTSTKQFIGNVTVPLSQKQQNERIEKYGKYDNHAEIATHALNAFIYGLSTFWKQFLAFHFTGNSVCAKTVAEWIVSLLRFLFSINLKPMLISMDSGKSNIAV